MSEIPAEGSITISGEKYIHLSRSLRARQKDIIKVFNGNGNFARAEIEKIDSNKITARIIEYGSFDNRPTTHLTLAFGLLPLDPLKSLLGGGTQLGVLRFIPFYSRLNDIIIPTDKQNKLLDRWNRILIENSSVAFRSHLPTIERPFDFEEIMEESKQFDHRFAFWEEGGDHWSAHLPLNEGTVIAVIGPKGGLHSDEIEFLKTVGFSILSFGELILKSEVAAISACARIIGK